jgi:hypothetical protein
VNPKAETPSCAIQLYMIEIKQNMMMHRIQNKRRSLAKD